ncbi:MAG: hypothetical protein ABEJ91_01665, partial [Candidatus Nanohaloarchaea archaeon]
MERRNLALSLLSLIVLASACVQTSGDNVGQESSRAILVESFTVSPNEIYEGTSIRVSLDIRNTGNLPATVNLGPKGKHVLKDYCPDLFNVHEFSLVTSGDRRNHDVYLKPGDSMSMRWQLSQQGDVPIYGYRCTIEAGMSFNYSVQAYRQIQVKRNREVEGSPELYWESSSGALRFAIETVGGTQARKGSFVATQGEKRSIDILLQLQNARGSSYSTGVVNVIERSLKVRATPPLKLFEGFVTEGLTESEVQECRDRVGEVNSLVSARSMELIKCINRKSRGGEKSYIWKNLLDRQDEPRCDVQSSEEIRIFEGESRIISCSVALPRRSSLEAPSVLSTIYAKVNYTYTKDIGSRRVAASGCAHTPVESTGTGTGAGKGLVVQSFGISDQDLVPGQSAIIRLKLKNYHTEPTEITKLSLYNTGMLDVGERTCTPESIGQYR